MICGRRLVRPCGIAAALVVLSITACTTVRVPSSESPERRPVLFRTQTGDQVTLQWEGEPGVVYSVIYTDSLSGAVQWRVLGGYDAIRGTGESQRATFTAPMPGTLYYRVQPRHLIAR